MDIDEKLSRIDSLYNDGCPDSLCCAKGCYSNFRKEDLKSICMMASELSFEPLGAFVSGFLLSSTSLRKQPNTNRGKHRPDVVKKSKDYILFGIPLCRNLFQLALGISSYSLHRTSTLSDSILTPEFKGYQDGRGGAKWGNHITNDMAESVIRFIDKVASKFGLPDPGRSPSDIDYGRRIYLPHSLSRTKIIRNVHRRT